MTTVYTTDYGHAAVEKLGAVIADIKRDDPLAPVTVAPPSVYSGLHLRRHLAVGGAGSGLLNVGFMPLVRIIELAGAPRLAADDWQPMTSSMYSEIIREALMRSDLFADVAGHPSTVQALRTAFRDLAAVSEETLEQYGGLDARTGEVVSLFRQCQERAENLKLFDRGRMAREAAQAVRAGADALKDLGRVVLFLPLHAGPQEVAFLRALGDLDRLTVVLGLTGEEKADALVRDLGERLEAPAPLNEANPEERDPPELIAVADMDEEVRQAARLVSGWLAEDIPLHRTAILFRHREPYARMVADVLEAAGLPFNGRSVETLADTPGGKVLMGALRAAGDGYGRTAVGDWLFGCPLVFQAKDVPGAAWEKLAREAGVVRCPPAEWRAKLGRHVRVLQQDAEDQDEAPEWLQERALRTKGVAEQLSCFIERLGELTAESTSSWSEHVGRALSLLDEFWDEEEAEQAAGSGRKVRQALEGLRALEKVRLQVGSAEFVQTVTELMSGSAGHTGRYGTGVFAGTLQDAQGLEFDRVVVLGLAEGSVPSLGSHDPIITEQDRLDLKDRDAAESPGRVNSPESERQQYLAALAAGKRAVALLPRANQRSGRPNIPSRYFLSAASAAAGRPVSMADLEVSSDWGLSIPSAENGLLTQPPGSLQEYLLRSLLRHRRSRPGIAEHFLFRCGHLSRGLECETGRRSSVFTEWDGLVGNSAMSPAAVFDNPLSPTSLEKMAGCPFRFFLDKVLRVDKCEEPRPTLTIEPLLKGSLLHQALQTFFEQHIGKVPDEKWSDAERDQLQEIAEGVLRQAEQDGLVSQGPLWEAEKRQILEDLDALLTSDEEHRQTNRMIPRKMELSFNGSCRTGGISFKGRMDRLDVSEDGTSAFVIDYKTGSSRMHKQARAHGPLVRGRLLQLAVYGLEARRQEGCPDVQAAYWYFTAKGKGETLATRLGDVEEEFGGLCQALRACADAGLYVANPEDLGREDNCTFCEWARCCLPERWRLWKRKMNDPSLDVYRPLLPEPEEDEQ